MTADAAVRFWLRWAEHRGALHESDADATQVVLPPDLQEALGLPEELAVTSDPEVAREDGAVLLGSGHPALDHATEDVLAYGDVGHIVLATPHAPPPGATTLLNRAREAFPIGHGRIDLAGPPEPEWVPVLRVGALVTFSVALDERYQERVETWLAVWDRVSLTDDVASRLAGVPRDTALPASAMPEGLDAAVAAAHEELGRWAVSRRDVLVLEVESARLEEIARTTAYYDAAVAALERRRVTAPPDRRPALETKIEVTWAERARRLTEVDEKFRPRHEIRPFRLHLVWVPALRLPALVRRGQREFPITLRWLTPARAFLPLPCPRCGAGLPLEAAKDRLGCTGCAAGRGRRP